MSNRPRPNGGRSGWKVGMDVTAAIGLGSMDGLSLLFRGCTVAVGVENTSQATYRDVREMHHNKGSGRWNVKY